MRARERESVRARERESDREQHPYIFPFIVSHNPSAQKPRRFFLDLNIPHGRFSEVHASFKTGKNSR